MTPDPSPGAAMPKKETNHGPTETSAQMRAAICGSMSDADRVATDEEIVLTKRLYDDLTNHLTVEKAARKRAEAMLKKHEYGWNACNRGNGSCFPQCPECEREPDKHEYSSRPTDYMKYCEWANIIKDTPEAPDAD